MANVDMNQDNKTIPVRKNLDEISFIRPVLIVMLVMFHAFNPWAGGWEKINNQIDCDAYYWWGKLNYSFMLESFVMISGYLFGCQLSKNKVKGLASLVLNKIKRLVFPSIVFSILYVIMFMRDLDVWQIVYTIVSGAGHMWFLPMLFWCFLFGYAVDKMNMKTSIKIICLIFLAVLSFIPVPLQMGRSLYYLLFFYGGMLLFRNKECLSTRINTPGIVSLWLIFTVLFVAGRLTIAKIDDAVIQPSIVYKIYRHGSMNLIKLIYSSFGTIALYATSLQYAKKHSASKLILDIGKLCFGIYLFQEFILKLLYYKTGFIDGTLGTPWMCFIFTLTVSAAISWIMRYFKVGRCIIG